MSDSPIGGNEFRDDELVRFGSEGATALPFSEVQGYANHEGARIWYAAFGNGNPVILLHGGLGHGGNWGYQVPALIEAGCRVVVVDSRGHGRSTRDSRPYSYDLMAGDVQAVMDGLGIARAAMVGWSDGACTALVLASRRPERVSGVFFFACNMDPSGTVENFVVSPSLERCIARHRRDYSELSETPDDFDDFFAAVGLMQRTQPNYGPADLAAISVPVTIAQSEFDEFIRPEHAAYLAESIPGAKFVRLPGVSHFAPLQRPGLFNRAVLEFLSSLGYSSASCAASLR